MQFRNFKAGLWRAHLWGLLQSRKHDRLTDVVAPYIAVVDVVRVLPHLQGHRPIARGPPSQRGTGGGKGSATASHKTALKDCRGSSLLIRRAVLVFESVSPVSSAIPVRDRIHLGGLSGYTYVHACTVGASTWHATQTQAVSCIACEQALSVGATMSIVGLTSRTRYYHCWH